MWLYIQKHACWTWEEAYNYLYEDDAFDNYFIPSMCLADALPVILVFNRCSFLKLYFTSL